MNLRYSANIMKFEDGMKKISAITWSSTGKKLAIASADKTVYLFDDMGQKKDKFPTKPSDKGQKSYLIRGLEFSPDSTKIAVAQSDNIVFIYKIGLQWGQKKAICNKFPVPASVTCMTWPKDQHNEVIFGLADGKIRSGVLKSNKSNVLYSADSYTVSLASSRDGNTVISGHLDGSVFAYSMENQSFKKIFTHHSIPYALGFGQNIMAAGNDQKVTFYDTYGNVLQRFDYTNEDKVKDFTVAAFNPSGDTVVLGNFNRFYVYNLNSKRGQWEEITCKTIENYYTVTAVCWKNDGSKLVTGNLCGSVDMYDASLKKVKLKGKFQLNYVSPSQVLIQILETGKQKVMKSNNGLEITKINIYQDKYAVGNTYQTLIVVDLETGRSSQIYWKGAGNQKFDFSSLNICMIFNAGELTLVQYGRNEPLGTIRTEYMKSNMISARISEKGIKMIAYLLDLQTISLFDLNTSSIISQINHDSKIDYLELNANANKLLFKDKRKQLYLYNLTTLTKTTLLPYCTFAKWVPESEVVVAQNRQNLNVWYSIDHPQKVTIYQIKGDVQSIERKNGKTEVLVSESGGNAVSSYSLNEELIDFGFALEARDFEKAAVILDNSQLNNETEANWKALARMALESQNVYVAEHCYGALGDVAKASFLRKIIKQIQDYEKETGRNDGISYYKVQAKLAVLERQFHRAQSILLENNEVEEAMQMYQELHKWDETIKIAEKKEHADVNELKEHYFNWLIQTGQQEKAGQIKENEGDYINAINHYLKGGIPARAANVVYNYSVSFPQDLLQKIAGSLASSGMFEKAGQLYEEMDMLQKALDCYVKGNAFKKAVDLAKSAQPRLVTSLEERWGNYLMSIKQTQAAINHYIEAEKIQKAIEAAILARQWNKAIQLLAHQTPEVARPYYRQIAKHYSSIRQYDFAEKYFLKAALPVDAFEMYAQAGKWENALRLAKENLPESEINNLYVKQAKKFEQQEKWKEAQKMYLIVEEYDLAIAMYKKCAQYDNMIRLVSKYRSNLLKQTHMSVAQKLHKDGNFKTAETHYIASGNWRVAVQMYKSQGMWEQAVKCSKLYGKDQYTCELAKRWAESLGPEQGMKMLLKMNLVDAVIQYLSDRNEFDEAFKMANLHAKHKIRDVHLKHAFKLEDEKRYKQAESEFVKAGKALQAISMYENIGDFHSALQVAGQYQPQARDGILINQARGFIEKREYAKAESAYINARKPQLAIKMYLDLGNGQEAIRVARKHAPHLVEQIMRRDANSNAEMTPDQRLQQAKTWDDTRNYSKAIDGYMQITIDDFKDTQLLEQIWRRAVQLAVTYEKDKAMNIVKIVCRRLCEIRNFDSAGELLEQVNLFQEAVATYCQGGNYEAARNCTKMIKNAELNAKLNDYINKKQRDTNKSSMNPWNALEQGDVETACQIFKQTGDWKNCLDKAREKNAQMLNKYLNDYIKVTLESGKFGDAAQAYAEYGMQLIPKNYPVYRGLAIEIFVDCQKNEIQPLRKALYDFVTLLASTTDQGNPTYQQFYKFLQIAHLVNLKFEYASKPAAQSLHMRVTISLLRYSEFIRLDKLFYEAGISCQKANNNGFASVLLNRYLDISEIIDDPETDNVPDENDFKISDIPSIYDVNMPIKNDLIPEAEKEKIKDWLLNINMNQKVDASLPLRPCQKCGAKIYDASITCYKCKNKSDLCILTGYPVNGANGIKCKSCGKLGLKEYWSQYLNCFANCPWCNKPPN